MGRFTAEEDQKILDLVKEGLEWPEIASRVDGRNTKQIRDRWNSKLDPELKPTTEPWTEDEDALLYHGYQAWGSAWGQVTSLIKGRSSNMATTRAKSNFTASTRRDVCSMAYLHIGDDAAAGRYYSATGMWRLPGAVPRRRRRAAVLQGARLRRVLKRGRGDRHVPILRRGPVAGGLFQRRAIAVAGGLLQRRGDRARAFEELGVIRKQYLETIVN